MTYGTNLTSRGNTAEPRLAVLLFVIAGCASLISQTSQAHGLHEQLYTEEQQLATAEKRQDKAYFQKKLDDGLIFVAYNGSVFTKPKILQSLHYIDVSRYSIQNMKVRALGADAGLVTYDLLLNANVAGHDLPSKQYTSSVWVRHGSDWLLIFHQSTPAKHK